MDSKQGQSQRLRAIVETIVQVAQPERVILFGSRAKGMARDGSDYDFLVVVRDIWNEREISRRIYRALLDKRVGAAVDVVVVNAGTLEQHKESPYYIYHRALQEGRVFYDRRGVRGVASEGREQLGNRPLGQEGEGPLGGPLL